jgi:hypothetical protein
VRRVKEADMRVALRVLAGVSMALSALAVGLLAWTWQAKLPGTDVRGYQSLPVGVLALLVAIPTVIVGAVATGQRRQFGWLAGLIVAGAFPFAGPFVAAFVVQVAQVSPTSLPACETATRPVLVCQLTFWQEVVALNLPLWLFLAGPFLVGLVALLASFQLGERVAADSLRP